MEAPKDWLQMLQNIRRVRQKYPAPVDSMGCDRAHQPTDKHIDQRFHILLSLMLSSQTKDSITWAALQKLKAAGLANVEAILLTQEKDIEELIYPVGFYRRKAVQLKKVAAILKEQYNGDIPKDLNGLCALPGVGPKMAHLCMQEAWNVNSGIAVDTHVHRIAARLGWVPAKNVKTPEQTRRALESWLPPEFWREINHLLVGFGQTICKPVGPKCHDCFNSEICPSANLDTVSGKGKSRTLAEPELEARSLDLDTKPGLVKVNKAKLDRKKPIHQPKDLEHPKSQQVRIKPKSLIDTKPEGKGRAGAVLDNNNESKPKKKRPVQLEAGLEIKVKLEPGVQCEPQRREQQQQQQEPLEPETRRQFRLPRLAHRVKMEV